MKNTYIIILMLFILGCTAQSPIIPKYNTQDYGAVENGYYKDVDHFHDQFVGTWVYTNGNTSLKVVFKNKIMFYNEVPPMPIYEDFLVGGYQYIESGTEKLNTLTDLVIDKPLIYDYNLYSGSTISKYFYPRCNECPENSLRLVMSYFEPATRNVQGLEGDFIIRHVTDNGVEKLIVQFKCHSGYGITYDNELTTANSLILPCMDYVLIKQP